MRPSLLIMLVLSIVLWCSYWPGNVFGHHHSSAFDERTWRRAGTYLTQYMDQGKKPCHDFFGHVCGNYGHQEHDDDGDEIFVKATNDQLQTITDTVRGLVEKLEMEEDRGRAISSSPSVESQVLRFYHQCLDKRLSEGDRATVTEKVLAASENAIRHLLLSSVSNTPVRVRNISSTEERVEGNTEPNDDAAAADRWRVISRLWKIFDATPYVIDLQDYRRTVYGLQLRIWRSYTGQNGSIEFNLKPFVQPISADLVDELTTSKLVSFAELILLVPNIRWRAYFDEVLGSGTSRTWLTNPDKAKFHVYGAGQLNKLGALINQMDDQQFNNTLTSGLAGALKDSVTGWANSSQKVCLKILVKRQPSALAFLYLRSIGSSPTEWRHEILSMRQNIFSAFRFLLNSVDWMDERDKEKVRSKLDEIRFFPGIPDWADDEEKVIQSMQQYSYGGHPDSSIPFETEIEWIKSDQSRLIQTYRSRQKVEEEEDEISTFKVDAYYHEDNTLKMMLGWMLPPVYDIKYPMAVKYGSIGYLMGHELIHAFDANELKRPSVAHQNDWLSEQAWKEFEKRKACVIKEYSKFCIEDKSYCVSGETNIGENMADVDGLKVAYTAFKFAKQVLGADPPIPAMLNYTADQLFFVANARTWCARGWNNKWMVDEHSPEKARVDVTLANNPVFGRAFKCQVGSKYAPLNECTVWGSLAEPAARKRRRRRRHHSHHPDNL